MPTRQRFASTRPRSANAASSERRAVARSLVEPARRSLLAAPQTIASRRHAGDLLEGARKMRLIGEAGVERDLRERYLGIAQQLARELDPQPSLLFGDA